MFMMSGGVSRMIIEAVKPSGQFALGIERGDEAVELLLCGQLAHEQQVRHLLEVEAAIGHAGVQQVVHVVAAIAQHTLVGYLLAV